MAVLLTATRKVLLKARFLARPLDNCRACLSLRLHKECWTELVKAPLPG